MFGVFGQVKDCGVVVGCFVCVYVFEDVYVVVQCVGQDVDFGVVLVDQFVVYLDFVVVVGY